MKTEKLGFLSKQFSSYEITFSKEGDLAEIINPFSCENIRVKYIPDDDFTPYMICFAFQHCCMSDEEDIIKYINDIIEGNRFSIEFFRDGTRCFGGDITAEEINSLSYETLEQYSGYFGLRKLKDLVDSFKLRGWKHKDNFDAVFVGGDDGSVAIKKLN